MSAGFKIQVSVKDKIGPVLAAKIRLMGNTKPVLEAMGLQLVSITQRAFNNSSLRVAAWAPKKVVGDDGHLVPGPACNLKLHGVLYRSIRIQKLTDTSVTVGTDRKYAAVHQFGAVIYPKSASCLKFRVGGKWFSMKKVVIPPRPFFPFIGHTLAPFAQVKIRSIAIAKFKSMGVIH